MGKKGRRRKRLPRHPNRRRRKLAGKKYAKELARLQVELSHLQAWVKKSGARIVIIFEGRDAAGKGGVIKRLTERVSPRVFRVVALPAPTDREKTQIYMQRYIAAPSRGRRDRDIRPLLVQPSRRRARDGLLQRGEGETLSGTGAGI